MGLAGIGNANLIALELGVGQFPMGIPFTILDKQSAGAISGVFAGLPEGALLDIGANRFRISYVGGNGNDITLTNTIPEPGAAVLAIAASILLLLRRKPQSASEPHAEND